MNRVVFTGGTGAGKTSVLEALAALGHATVGDSARTIITERLARGADRRPDPITFACAIVRRDIEQYLAVAGTSGWIFFDRGVFDALGMLHEVSPLPPAELAAMLSTYRFHASVFVFPPWRGIYTNDVERDQSFEAGSMCTPRWYGGTARVATFSMKCPPLPSGSAPNISAECLASRPSAEHWLAARTAHAGSMRRNRSGASRRVSHCPPSPAIGLPA